MRDCSAASRATINPVCYLGTEAFNPEGLVPRAIRLIKEKFPEAIVVTDVALDPYSSMVIVFCVNLFL